MVELQTLRRFLASAPSLSDLAQGVLSARGMQNASATEALQVEQEIVDAADGDNLAEYRNAADRLIAQRDDPEPREKTEKRGGDFFAIDAQVWAGVCDLQKNNLAVAYLVMAMGSSGGNMRTRWSAEAIHQHSGMSWRDAKQAIATLMAEGFVQLDPESPKSRPRYILPSFSERDRATRRAKSANSPSLAPLLEKSSFTAQERSKLHAAGYTRGSGDALAWWPENEPTPDSDRIWLPNALILGAPGWDGPAPIRQFFHMGDIWTLRLLIDLYHFHFLDSHQGIDRAWIWRSYEAKQLGQRGAYNVWGFKLDGGSFEHKQGGPFVVQFEKRKQAAGAGQHPAWDSMALLTRMKLVSHIPHLFTNGNPETRPLHALGGQWHSAEPEETAVRESAIRAGKACLQVGQIDQAGDFDLIVPVPHYLTPKVWGVYRLRFRPHTSATARWYEQLKTQSPEWVKKYDRLESEALKSAPALTEWEAWGT